VPQPQGGGSTGKKELLAVSRAYRIVCCWTVAKSRWNRWVLTMAVFRFYCIIMHYCLIASPCGSSWLLRWRWHTFTILWGIDLKIWCHEANHSHR